MKLIGATEGVVKVLNGSIVKVRNRLLICIVAAGCLAAGGKPQPLSFTGLYESAAAAAALPGGGTLAAADLAVNPEDRLSQMSSEIASRKATIDGVIVVVNKQNTWAMDLTVEELSRIWNKDSKVKSWNEVRPEWPAEEIVLFGPDASARTFKFFTLTVNGAAKRSRGDYTVSHDDSALVRRVAGNKYALGYLSYSAYKQNDSMLNFVAIKKDTASPRVAPSLQSIRSGAYVLGYPSKSAIHESAR
jgi:ABC-type phosphate transport system substrate-binding protein